MAASRINFIVVIESTIDMCNHIISRNGYRVPEDYADTFKVVREVGAFDPSFSQQLVKMAKFRYRLVHLCWEINDTQLYSILEDHLGDLEKILNSIALFLGLQNDSSTA